MSIQIIKTAYGITRKWCCDHCDFTRLDKAQDGDVPGTTITVACRCAACSAAESGKLTTPPAFRGPPTLARLIEKQAPLRANGICRDQGVDQVTAVDLPTTVAPAAAPVSVTLNMLKPGATFRVDGLQDVFVKKYEQGAEGDGIKVLELRDGSDLRLNPWVAVYEVRLVEGQKPAPTPPPARSPAAEWESTANMYQAFLFDLLEHIDPNMFEEPDDSGSMVKYAKKLIDDGRERIKNAEERCVRLGEENERLRLGQQNQEQSGKEGGPNWKAGSLTKGHALFDVAKAAGYGLFTMDEEGMKGLVEFVGDMKSERNAMLTANKSLSKLLSEQLTKEQDQLKEIFALSQQVRDLSGSLSKAGSDLSCARERAEIDTKNISRLTEESKKLKEENIRLSRENVELLGRAQRAEDRTRCGDPFSSQDTIVRAKRMSDKRNWGTQGNSLLTQALDAVERLERELFDTQLRTSIQEAARDGAVKELTLAKEAAKEARETLNNIAHVVNISRPLDLNEPVDRRILVDAVQARVAAYKSLTEQLKNEQDLGALARGTLKTVAESFDVMDALNYTDAAHVDRLVRIIRDKGNELKRLKTPGIKHENGQVSMGSGCGTPSPDTIREAISMAVALGWPDEPFLKSALQYITKQANEISNLRCSQPQGELRDRAQAMGSARKWSLGRLYLASALDEIEALDKKLEAANQKRDEKLGEVTQDLYTKAMADIEATKRNNRALLSEMEGIKRQRNGAYERIEDLEKEVASLKAFLVPEDMVKRAEAFAKGRGWDIPNGYMARALDEIAELDLKIAAMRETLNAAQDLAKERTRALCAANESRNNLISRMETIRGALP